MPPKDDEDAPCEAKQAEKRNLDATDFGAMSPPCPFGDGGDADTGYLSPVEDWPLLFTGLPEDDPEELEQVAKEACAFSAMMGDDRWALCRRFLRFN